MEISFDQTTDRETSYSEWPKQLIVQSNKNRENKGKFYFSVYKPDTAESKGRRLEKISSLR